MQTSLSPPLPGGANPRCRSSLRLEIVLHNNWWKDKASITMTFLGLRAWVHTEDVRHFPNPTSSTNWRKMRGHLSSCMLPHKTVIFGPMVVNWYRLLERSIRFPGRPNLEIVGRVAADQLIFTPVNMLLFFSVLTTLEVKTPDLGSNTYSVPTYAACWKKSRGGRSSRNSAAVIHLLCWPIGRSGRQCSW